MTVNPPAALRVLLVDDNEGDHLLLREAAEVNAVAIKLTSCFAGPQALRHLAQDTAFDLIVADINMPIMSGMEFLAHIEENPLLTQVPRVLLSSSTALPASAAATVSAPCLTKPTAWSEYAVLVHVLHEVMQACSGRAESERQLHRAAAQAARHRASVERTPTDA